MNNKIYAFVYNSCIYESQGGVVSLHKKRKGAEMALEFHKTNEYKEWERIFVNDESWIDSEFGETESWYIVEYDILD